MGDSIPVTAFLPESIAKGLTRDTLLRTIKRSGGLREYQQILNDLARQQGYLELMPYEVEVMREVGLSIPDSIQIVTPQ